MNNHTSHAGRGPHRKSDKETFWRKTLKEQADSGQNVRAFCRARGLTEPSFYAWRRTIAERNGNNASRDARTRRPGFVELRPGLVASAASGELEVPLEIVAGDRRLLIRTGCDRTLLREVLAALEE